MTATSAWCREQGEQSNKAQQSSTFLTPSSFYSCRTSTLAQRAPFFVHEGRSAIDAFSSESGGRLFVNKNEENDHGLFEELMFYGERHDLAPLSSLKAKLREANFVVDDRDYTHQFRLRRSKQENDAMKAAFDELLVKSETGVEGVSKTANLGCSDFFPSTSGKRSVGAFLASKMRELNEISDTAGHKKRLCVFTCGDDDNDVELAKGDFVDFSIFPKKVRRVMLHLRIAAATAESNSACRRCTERGSSQSRRSGRISAN